MTRLGRVHQREKLAGAEEKSTEPRTGPPQARRHVGPIKTCSLLIGLTFFFLHKLPHEGRKEDFFLYLSCVWTHVVVTPGPTHSTYSPRTIRLHGRTIYAYIYAMAPTYVTLRTYVRVGFNKIMPYYTTAVHAMYLSLVDGIIQQFSLVMITQFAARNALGSTSINQPH